MSSSIVEVLPLAHTIGNTRDGGGGGGAADLEHTELELEKHIPWRTAQTSSVHSAGMRERPSSTTTTAITGDTCSLNVR